MENSNKSLNKNNKKFSKIEGPEAWMMYKRNKIFPISLKETPQNVLFYINVDWNFRFGKINGAPKKIKN